MGQYSIVPNSIMSGFKRSGIYFFNPKALNHGANGSSSCVISGSSSSANDGSSSVNGNSIGDFGCLSANNHYGFTSENDYDILDPVYLQWLKVYIIHQD